MIWAKIESLGGAKMAVTWKNVRQISVRTFKNATKPIVSPSAKLTMVIRVVSMEMMKRNATNINVMDYSDAGALAFVCTRARSAMARGSLAGRWLTAMWHHPNISCSLKMSFLYCDMFHEDINEMPLLLTDTIQSIIQYKINICRLRVTVRVISNILVIRRMSFTSIWQEIVSVTFANPYRIYIQISSKTLDPWFI